MSQQNNIPASLYKNFSTETLESMLRDMTLSENELDLEQLDAIMAELDRREGAPETLAPEEALNIFRETYAGEESAFMECVPMEPTMAENVPDQPRTKRRWPRLIMLAAAIVVLAGVMAVTVTGGTGALGEGKWSSEKFTLGTFFFGNEEENKTERVFVWPESDIPEDAEFSSLQECLDAFEIDFEIAEPTWIPDGFKFWKLYFVYDNEFPTADFIAEYINEENEFFSVSFYSYTDTPTVTYEKTEAPVETYTVDGITYHAMSNTASEKVVWLTEHFQCDVTGPLSRETIKEIAASISPASSEPNDRFFVSAEELERQYNEKHFFWPEADVPENTEFTSLQEALDAYGINFEIAEPSWIPNGYEICQIEAYYSESRLDIMLSDICFYAAYQNQNGNIIGLSFQNCEDEDAPFTERIDASAQRFASSRYDYYKSINGDCVKIMWTTGHFDCSLYGDLTDKEWVSIVDSISPREQEPDERFYASQADLDKIGDEERSANEEAMENGTYIEEKPAELVWSEAFIAEGTQFSGLQECLIAHGVTTEIMAPKLLPEGYHEKTTQYEYDFDRSTACFKTIYENENGEQLIFTINRYSGSPSSVYTNTNDYVLAATSYALDYAIQYYLITEPDCQKYIWLTENFECEIVGPADCEIDNFMYIANSTQII